jgi:hypothetical protein
MTPGTSTTALLRRHRDKRAEPVAEPRRSDEGPHAADPLGPEPLAIAVARMRRLAVAPQDQAMYTCNCGYVFAAEVSTSVGCPYCGVAQAW